MVAFCFICTVAVILHGWRKFDKLDAKMKKLIPSAFSLRRSLIRSGKSHIPGEWAEKEMQRIEYWLANGGNAINTARKNADILRILMTPSFIEKFNEKLKNGTAKNNSQPMSI